MNGKHLITPEEVGVLARPISKHVDLAELLIFIDESELNDIKPAVGDQLFMNILNGDESGILLDGGEYTGCNDTAYYFSGLKKSLAYYVYGKLIKNGGRKLTRTGAVNKDNEYSSQVEAKERVQAANDAFAIADRYLKECLMYIQVSTELFPEYKGRGIMKANRVRIKSIGD